MAFTRSTKYITILCDDCAIYLTRCTCGSCMQFLQDVMYLKAPAYCAEHYTMHHKLPILQPRPVVNPVSEFSTV